MLKHKGIIHLVFLQVYYSVNCVALGRGRLFFLVLQPGGNLLKDLELAEEDPDDHPDHGIYRYGQHHTEDTADLGADHDDDKDLERMRAHLLGKDDGLQDEVVYHLHRNEYKQYLEQQRHQLRIERQLCMRGEGEQYPDRTADDRAEVGDEIDECSKESDQQGIAYAQYTQQYGYIDRNDGDLQYNAPEVLGQQYAHLVHRMRDLTFDAVGNKALQELREQALFFQKEESNEKHRPDQYAQETDQRNQ